jgi:hypothetical protein
MTDARLRRFWHRTGMLSAFGALTLAAVAQGCGGDDTDPDPSGSNSSGSSSSTGGVTPPPGPIEFKLAGNGPSAFDTTPDPDGTTLYFTGLTADGIPGVFKVPADGSAPTPVTVTMGGVLTAPFGIGIDTKGTTIFVSDPGADVLLAGNETGNDQGAIFAVSVSGGEPTPVAGTEDAIPRSIDIVEEEGKDVLYFTGTDKSDGQPGVFSVPSAGGAVTVVFKGAPLQDPSGIAVAKDGTVYVADTVSSADQKADIIVISGGKATVAVSGLRVGYPCGIALNKADSGLLVSALDPDTLTDIVVNVDLASMEPTTLESMTINTFSEAAGLHRAKNADVFGWADSSAGPNGGSVFLVK